MTTSFAAYASQFLSRQQNLSSSLSSSSQPLFYSFTTDDGSRAGDPSRAHNLDLDDEDDPHLRFSSGNAANLSQDYSRSLARDEDDPYLRLDDVDEEQAEQRLSDTVGYDADSLPLIASERTQEPSQGWIAHQAPASYLHHPPSPPSDTSSDSGIPPRYLLATHDEPRPPHSARPHTPLTESLLPRDGSARPVDVFSLPDPRRHSRGRVIYKDSVWTAIWLTSVCACLLGSFLILFTTHTPGRKSKGLPYTTLLHTIPLLTVLTFISAIVSYAHIFLLSLFARPVIFATSVFIPVALFISSVWAFIGSFMWEEGSEPTWGETIGYGASITILQ